MKRRLFQFVLLPILGGFATLGASATSGTLVLHLEGFRNDRGHAAITLYKGPDGFPTKPDKAFRKAQQAIRTGKAETRFENLPPGVYAVGVLHDENANDRLDTNFIGLPREGVGASNNVPGRFGPPRFQDATFPLTSGTLELGIRIEYLLK